VPFRTAYEANTESLRQATASMVAGSPS
jgi:hypothetical protein